MTQLVSSVLPDGSRTAQGVGAGIYWKSAKVEIVITLMDNAMIFQAEV